MNTFIKNKTASHSESLINILAPVNTELNKLETFLLEYLYTENIVLNQITEYILKSGGKRLRPAMCYLFCKLFNNGTVNDNNFKLGAALELIHTATLLHDDVIDEANSRRDIDTINKQWGNKVAILAGDFFLSQALKLLNSIQNSEIQNIFINAVEKICSGEIEQSFSKFKHISINEYIEKSKRKTALLFMAGTKSTAILANKPENQVKIAENYAINTGIAFQIIDDILNITAPAKITGKPQDLDLLNGILTAPVIYALDYYQEEKDNTLSSLINNKFKNKNDIHTAIDLILQTDGVNKSKELAKNYIQQTCSELKLMEDSIYKHNLISLANFITDRSF